MNGLTDTERATVEGIVQRLEAFGDAVESWFVKSSNATRNGITLTIRYDRAADPLTIGAEAQQIFGQSPELLVLLARRLLTMDTECRRG